MKNFERLKSKVIISLASLCATADILMTPNYAWWLWLDKVSCSIAIVVASLQLWLPKFYKPQLHFIPLTILVIYALIYSWLSPGYVIYIFTMLTLGGVLSLNLFPPKSLFTIGMFATFLLVVLWNAYFQGTTLSYYEENPVVYTQAVMVTTVICIATFITFCYLVFRLFQLQQKEKSYFQNRLAFQSDLFSIIAHNIRTPLANVQSQIDIARIKNEEINTERIDQSVQQLTHIAKDIIRHQQLTKHQKPLLLLDLIHNLSLQFNEDLIIENNAKDNFDTHYGIQLALENFIQNPIRLESKVVLTIESSEDGNTFRVTDTAGGIEREILEQLGAPLKNSRGLGLGIFLSLENLNYLGYECLVGTTLGSGTEVVISNENNFVTSVRHEEVVQLIKNKFQAYSAQSSVLT
jgi:signal transduction histidine kinase